MGFRKVQRRIRDEAGNVVGGTNFEVRIYSNYGAGTLGSPKLDPAGADARPNPGYPNSGWQTTLTTQLLGTDSSAIVASTAGIQVGDVFQVVDGNFFHVLVVKAVPNGTTITLEQTPNAAGSPTGAHTYPVSSTVGDPGNLGHWQGWLQDSQDYDLTVKNVATGKESTPDQLFILQTSGVIGFQDEGVSTGTQRGVLNFIGPGIAAADDAGNSRVNVTLDPNGFILAGTNAGRPAAGVNGRIYVTTDAPITIQRDNGATWLAAGFQNPMTASGDIIYGGTSGAQTRLAAGAYGPLVIAAGIPSWAGLSIAEASLGADLTTFTSGTWQDGPSVSLNGSYLIVAQCQILSGGQVHMEVRLTNGTAVEASGEVQGQAAATGYYHMVLVGIITTSGSETWKIQATGQTGGGNKLLAATPDNGQGNNATRIVAVRYA